MTLGTYAAYIGKRATVTFDGGFAFECTISDVKQSYGNTRYLVTPVAGTGTNWVDSSRVKEVGK